jgi:hypothetical protein
MQTTATATQAAAPRYAVHIRFGLSELGVGHIAPGRNGPLVPVSQARTWPTEAEAIAFATSQDVATVISRSPVVGRITAYAVAVSSC